MFQWFHNSNREASNKRETINLQKLTRAPAVWQAYQTLHWKKLKPIVTAELAKLTVDPNCKPEDIRSERLQVQTRVAMAEYDAESDTVKDQVQKYLEERKNKVHISESPAQLQKCVIP